MLFKPRRLLTDQASVTFQFGPAEQKTELLEQRATRTASFPQDIEGYRHGGLNE
jgi:hypothetical protein